jgi:hypothetical protein
MLAIRKAVMQRYLKDLKSTAARGKNAIHKIKIWDKREIPEDETLRQSSWDSR